MLDVKDELGLLYILMSFYYSFCVGWYFRLIFIVLFYFLGMKIL